MALPAELSELFPSILPCFAFRIPRFERGGDVADDAAAVQFGQAGHGRVRHLGAK